MNLEQLGKFLKTSEPFRPMNKMDWMTFGGANPGTYISYDQEGGRVLFAEYDGNIGILYTGPEPYEGDNEINLHLGEFIDGFSEEEINKLIEYNRSLQESERIYRASLG